jgi:type II secretory pathway pseudopilin PulG
MIAFGNRARRRPAWSLLEVTAVIAVLGVLLALTFATVAGTMRTEKATLASFQKLAAQSALADQFRADVARAKSTPDKLDTFVKSPACLILELPDRSNIIYRWDKGDLTRSTISATGTSAQRLPLGEKGAVAEFAWVAAGPSPLVTLRIKGQTLQEITAALGGDYR